MDLRLRILNMNQKWHHPIFATRMNTDEVLLALKELDQVGYHAIEIWGGATFD